MATVKTVTKSVISRDWNELEPKLITFLATGVTASGLVAAAAYFGFTLPAGEASVAVVLISTIAGYVKKSTTTLPTSPNTPVAASAPEPVAVPAPAEGSAPIA